MGKKGLWANMHAKRKRGESPAKPGDKDYPTDKALKDSAAKMVSPFKMGPIVAAVASKVAGKVVDKAIDKSPFKILKNFFRYMLNKIKIIFKCIFNIRRP